MSHRRQDRLTKSRCRCGAEFCYVCGVAWKRCRCPQWHEERLYARANIIADRDAPNLAADNPERVGLVAAAADMLRDRHNCEHVHFDFVRGEHDCELCHQTLPVFIMECGQCRIQVCRRCRNNRL